MAHDLYRDEQGKYGYIGRRPAWHELGNVIGQYLTWEQIAEKGHLNYQVEKHQLINPFTQKPDAWGVFRMDTKVCLGTVGQNYQPIQHRRGFVLLDHIIGQQNGAHYECAGVLGKGEKVWGLADINVPLRIKGTDDVSENYLLFTTSHDGSHSFQVRITSTRVVCQNTLNQLASLK